MEVVNHDSSYSTLQSVLQLGARLVIAVEVNEFHGEINRSGDGQLSAGDHIEA